MSQSDTVYHFTQVLMQKTKVVQVF